jgi:hypothetical protein
VTQNSEFSFMLEFSSGGRRIRTFVAEATDLQSVPFDRSGIPPLVDFGLEMSKIEAKHFYPKKTEPPIGIEPMTY